MSGDYTIRMQRVLAGMQPLKNKLFRCVCNFKEETSVNDEIIDI